MRLRWLLWLAPVLVVLAVGSVYWGSEKNLRIQSDNFVVWVPQRKVLFAGDLAKSMGSGKGNVAEADQDEWPEVVRRVMAAYPDVRVVVPGHGRPGGPELLQFTVELFSAGE